VVRFKSSETRRAKTDVAAARDHDAPRGRFLAAHLVHHHADILARGEKEHLVAVLDDRGAFGLDALAGAINGGDPRVGGGNMLP
jgi:hypothetical protein